MRSNLASIALAGALAITTGATLAQPMMGPGGGYMHGPGAGMMGRGWGYIDPAGYLGDLKLVLRGSQRRRSLAGTPTRRSSRMPPRRCRVHTRRYTRRWAPPAGKNAAT